MQTSDISYRNSVIYSIYVRNHTQEGTFRAVEPDLKRIRDLGTDMVWLMPVHPIGQKGQEGKGPMLIYAGQEFSCTTKPSLFDIDVFDRNGKDISSEIAQFVTMKKSLPTDAVFQAKLTGRNTVEASYYSDNKTIVSREFAL